MKFGGRGSLNVRLKISMSLLPWVKISFYIRSKNIILLLHLYKKIKVVTLGYYGVSCWSEFVGLLWDSWLVMGVSLIIVVNFFWFFTSILVIWSLNNVFYFIIGVLVDDIWWDDIFFLFMYLLFKMNIVNKLSPFFYKVCSKFC